MWKVYLGWVSQSSSICILIQSQYVHPETRVLRKKPLLRYLRRTSEKTALSMWPRNGMEMYSSSNAQHNTLRKGYTKVIALLITKKNQWLKWYFTGSWNTKITKNTKKKVVTDMGEGEHCKKYSRDLMNISKKGQNPFFSIYSLCGCYRRRDMFVCW